MAPDDPLFGRMRPDMHEAGHAVVYVLLGFRVQGLDISERESNQSGGITGIDPPCKEAIKGKGLDAVRPLLVAIMGGYAAQSIVCTEYDLNVSCRQDYREVEYWAELAHYGIVDLTVPELRAIEEEAKTEARRLVNENLGAVYCVAGMLLQRGRVTGDEVVDALRHFSPNTKFGSLKT